VNDPRELLLSMNPIPALNLMKAPIGCPLFIHQSAKKNEKPDFVDTKSY
jgi:hypothetical protein